MDETMDLARRLGRAIADSAPSSRVREARGLVRADKDAMDLMAQFQRQAQKVAQLEQDRKPVEVDDKHRLEDLENRLAANDKVKRLTEAEMDYMDLLRRVNETIQRELQDIEGEA